MLERATTESSATARPRNLYAFRGCDRDVHKRQAEGAKTPRPFRSQHQETYRNRRYDEKTQQRNRISVTQQFASRLFATALLGNFVNSVENRRITSPHLGSFQLHS